ncbi:deaminase domain-containing protein [Pseudomonas sp. UFMG81]|uniref:deaminase domain-containing protein n=1 Tax=Pseudomonas sp. UFMG81 TaxID=2745936 RepID=UPI00188FE034|nr:deaminase domain-containing protein [Pseudomonas sp. UFMG81]
MQRPHLPALELGDALDLPVLAEHLLEQTPGHHLFEKLLNHMQASLYYGGWFYPRPAPREPKAGVQSKRVAHTLLEGSALNAPADQALDALLGSRAFDQLGKKLAAALQWDTSYEGKPMYLALAEQALIDALYPAQQRRPGYLLDFELFSELNKSAPFSEIRLALTSHLHARIGGLPAMAQLASELLMRRFAPELLIDDAPDDFLYTPDLRWANLRQGAQLLLARHAPLTFDAAEQATHLPQDHDTALFDSALANTLAEWAQLQGFAQHAPPWSKHQWQTAYDHYLNAWDLESLRNLPDRFESAREMLRLEGFAPDGKNVDNQLHINAYLDHGADYKKSPLPDATAMYDRAFEQWRKRAQNTYEDILQRMLRHLPLTEQERLSNSTWSAHAVTWPFYIGSIKGAIPTYADTPASDWRDEVGTLGILVHLPGDKSDTLYELFPEQLEWRSRQLPKAQAGHWADSLDLKYRDYNETDLPWHVSPWPKTIKLIDSPAENRLQALGRSYATSVALGNREALYIAGKGATPLEHAAAQKLKTSTGRYIFKLFSNLVPLLGCFDVRNGSEALSCGLDALGTFGAVTVLGGRIIKPLMRLRNTTGASASAMRLGMFRAARHWKDQAIPTQLHRHAAGPKHWPGPLEAGARQKLSDPLPQNKLLPGHKPDVISLLLGEGDDITRAWDKASNPVVLPLFIARDPDTLDAIINGVAYRHRIGQPGGLAQRVQHMPLQRADNPVLQASPYPDAPAQGIALYLAPATQQAGTPAYGQHVSRAFESIRIEPAPITYRPTGAASDSVAQVMVRENRLVQYTEEILPGRGRHSHTGRMILKALSDDEAEALGVLNPPHYYNEGVRGYPLGEHWFGLPADMTPAEVARLTGYCPPVRLGRLSHSITDRRTLRGARVAYLDEDWLLVEADTGVFYGTPFDFDAWQRSQTRALLQGTLTPTLHPAPAASTGLTFTRVTDLNAITQYLDVSETYRLVATRANLQQDIDNLANLLGDWIRHRRRNNPPTAPTPIEQLLDTVEEQRLPELARNILTSPNAQDQLTGLSMSGLSGLNKEVIANWQSLVDVSSIERLHINGVLNRLLPAAGSKQPYTPLSIAELLSDAGKEQLRKHLSGANLAFATVTLKDGSRRVYFSLSGGKASKRIQIAPPAEGERSPVEYIDARARMQGLDPDPRFTDLPILRRAEWLTIKVHKRHLDSERLIASTLNRDLLTQADQVEDIQVFTLLDACRSCGGHVLPRLRLDYPDATFSVAWLLPYTNN